MTTYILKLENESTRIIRRALGLLPHDEVRGLIEDIGGQMVQQDREASLPPVDPPSPEAA